MRPRWSPDRLVFGADYNPEQWPEAIWRDDIALMAQAKVNTVTLGVFSWVFVEPEDGRFEWDRMDRLMAMLHDAGIGVNLATPTAAPPMWLLDKHPEIAFVNAQGLRAARGGRLCWSANSATFRRYALRVVRQLGERYGAHPALRLWHVSNELGNENEFSWDDETCQAWRRWLRTRYDSIAHLNDAWGLDFWGRRYGSFDQVDLPRFTGSQPDPAAWLDFERFSSDSHLAHYQAERDILCEVSPGVPVTTNFMVMGAPRSHDYEGWAPGMDVVANDHYSLTTDPRPHLELALSADRVRGMAGGKPWLLMESAISAVNWQPVNRARQPGEALRRTLGAVARGADGAMYFQWRASRAGAEQYHSALVPHAGADSTTFRQTVQVGTALDRLSEVVGSTVERGRAGLLFGVDATRAWRSGSKPSDRLSPFEFVREVHHALVRAGVTVEILAPDAPLDEFDVVFVPGLYLAPAVSADLLEDFLRKGGHVLVTPLSGIVDESNAVLLGGYPGRYRELLGLRVDEYLPVADGARLPLSLGLFGERWSERVETRGAEVVAQYLEGPLRGRPSITRNEFGNGTATYVSTCLDEAGWDEVIGSVLTRAGVTAIADSDPDVEVVRRRKSDGTSWLFALNHADEPRRVRTRGHELLTDLPVTGELELGPGGVAVVREER